MCNISLRIHPLPVFCHVPGHVFCPSPCSFHPFPGLQNSPALYPLPRPFCRQMVFLWCFETARWHLSPPLLKTLSVVTLCAALFPRFALPWCCKTAGGWHLSPTLQNPPALLHLPPPYLPCSWPLFLPNRVALRNCRMALQLPTSLAKSCVLWRCEVKRNGKGRRHPCVSPFYKPSILGTPMTQKPPSPRLLVGR